jgi:succinate dehydrogenase / fumarate reductase iron-sulfur subunit
MNINGVTGLACKTPVAQVLKSTDNSVSVDPMPNFQPMKDLVVHMDPFWDKYSRLKPYLQPKPTRIRTTSASAASRPRT